MKPLLISFIPLPQETLHALSEHYDVHRSTESDTALPDAARVVVTNGTTGMTDETMAKLPQLGLICSFGAGYENIDVEAAGRREIVVANAPGTNVATVADHTIGFLLALTRRQESLSNAVKSGQWATSREARPTLTGSSIGIVGMGRVGRLVAERAEAFDMRIGYFGRSVKDGAPGTFFGSLVALAQASDFLVLACPGGKATRHLVDREVLRALGPRGYLVNVARGSVVDTEALIDSLRHDEIAGAALDVLETEPEVPQALLDDERVLITPHMAGRSPASFQAQTDALLSSLNQYLAGMPVTSAVQPART
ncbi:hydroxyacid dehydrogenase [Burkholderia sp. WAC0059]|uniref:2-hydroxyacid dehydrogenase n=1 Tax=Burkholderia sp. WAC0059 TaxID=2066022 RepID=UPI000C7F735E|nr:2-hydroxyacid dehydrogenase [Burkholderia sp. WAC0059]PLZ00593.1 hydroxyacid dehydrogenase [Burkholderia sp. WAC0059]